MQTFLIRWQPYAPTKKTLYMFKNMPNALIPNYFDTKYITNFHS